MKHGLIETQLPNLYLSPYSNQLFVMLFYRTNHGWYFTSRDILNIDYDIDSIRVYDWTIINLYEPLEVTIKKFGKSLEHQHEILIMWLKLSELMYI